MPAVPAAVAGMLASKARASTWWTCSRISTSTGRARGRPHRSTARPVVNVSPCPRPIDSPAAWCAKRGPRPGGRVPGSPPARPCPRPSTPIDSPAGGERVAVPAADRRRHAGQQSEGLDLVDVFQDLRQRRPCPRPSGPIDSPNRVVSEARASTGWTCSRISTSAGRARDRPHRSTARPRGAQSEGLTWWTCSRISTSQPAVPATVHTDRQPGRVVRKARA